MLSVIQYTKLIVLTFVVHLEVYFSFFELYNFNKYKTSSLEILTSLPFDIFIKFNQIHDIGILRINTKNLDRLESKFWFKHIKYYKLNTTIHQNIHWYFESLPNCHTSSQHDINTINNQCLWIPSNDPYFPYLFYIKFKPIKQGLNQCCVTIGIYTYQTSRNVYIMSRWSLCL